VDWLLKLGSVVKVISSAWLRNCFFKWAGPCSCSGSCIWRCISVQRASACFVNSWQVRYMTQTRRMFIHAWSVLKTPNYIINRGNGFWMWQCNLFRVFASLTGICHLCCTTICSRHWLDVLERINCKPERYCATLLAGERSEVPGRLLRASFGSRRLSVTTFSQFTPPYCATLPAEHIQLPGLSCGWSDFMELIFSMIKHSVVVNYLRCNYLRVIKMHSVQYRCFMIWAV